MALGALLFALPFPYFGDVVFAEGIPEPGLVLYGQVWNTEGGQNIRLTTGTLVWTFQPASAGAPVVLTASLTNLLDQFSYMLIVPVESQVGTLVASSNVLRIATPPVGYIRTNVFLDGQPVFLRTPDQASFVFTPERRGMVERVDLTLQREDQDSDGDGLPDWWEDLYFAGNADADADSDGDGVRNLAEYRAGTDPTDVSSMFEFIRIEPDPMCGIRVEWSSASYRTYILQRSDQLLGGFVDIVTDLPATPPVNVYCDYTATGSGPYFYRLRLQEGTVSLADADGNGIADEWEWAYFGRIRTDPDADADGDLASNAAEAVAGTNPLEAGSVLQLVRIEPAAGGVTLEWESAVNRFYRVLRSADPQGGYLPVALQIPATPPRNVFEDVPNPIPGPCFYRVQVEP